MNRTTTLIAAAVLLVVALYAAVHFSGRTTPQPTEAPTPPVTDSAPAPAAPAPAAPAPATPTTPANPPPP
ncbi:hypothetical protein J2X65_000983 [Ancylobacter sp. 3268]|uniref:hypothetical protein n=1 Tax=Ancylobacter sp. 3268 TaxID=2817752 RepID=UPI00285FC8CD|nr:hypothetical protein [Ancylobacter sp. 3268]MDR6951634.1 hypothetical protein [Ancylobacter sp. 3268]